jgi:hypothetical protein
MGSVGPTDRHLPQTLISQMLPWPFCTVARIGESHPCVYAERSRLTPFGVGIEFAGHFSFGFGHILGPTPWNNFAADKVMAL